jgi:hypothetical protein
MTRFLPALTSGQERREGRLLARAVDEVDRQTDLGLAKIEHAADLQVGRVQAIGYVGKRAMQEIALVSQLEVQLTNLVPSAAPRLMAIGDMVALGAADVVSETVRRVSR